MKKHSSLFIVPFAIGIVVLGVFLVLGVSKQKLTFSNKTIVIEVVESQEARTQGLGGRKKLKQDKGMLFVFQNSDRHAIWMKDMNFPLDILWLDDTKQVIHIEEDVAPETYPQTFTSNNPAKYVLEVNSGFVQEHRVKVGDTANFTL